MWCFGFDFAGVECSVVVVAAVGVTIVVGGERDCFLFLGAGVEKRVEDEAEEEKEEEDEEEEVGEREEGVRGIRIVVPLTITDDEEEEDEEEEGDVVMCVT